MSDQNARQQIIDGIKEVDNILVTVSRNPSVDALSAALGFTLLLNKLGKHGTAVFSGDIPPAITFLDPKKTFENTVDSLRDFIIALDKEKADHLRYKLVGDMVKIFITPYRTTISDQDLDFSQGDYNVEMVIAIGVENNDDLDKALSDHGRILHDAKVASVSIGEASTELGSISWQERRASSYSELLASLAEDLRSDKSLLDEQTATAFLTGIVAATERFSNQQTSSKAMTVSAQLMAAGANQQLIATKLEEAQAKEESEASEVHTNRDGSTEMVDGKSSKINRRQKKSNKKSTDKDSNKADSSQPAADGTLTISHEKRGDVDEVRDQIQADSQAAAANRAEASLRQHEESIDLGGSESSEENSKDEQEKADEALAQKLAATNAADAAPSVEDLQKDLQAAELEIDEAASQPPVQPEISLPQLADTEQSAPPATEPEPVKPEGGDEPDFGGTLNATSEQAAADSLREQNSDRNKTILSHSSAPLSGQPRDLPAVNSFNQTADLAQGEPASVDPFGGANAPTAKASDVTPPTPSVEPMQFEPTPASAPTLADLDKENREHSDARQAIDEALNAPEAPPAPTVANDLPPMPELPPLPPMPSDFSQLPPLPPAPAGSPEDQLSAALPPAPAPNPAAPPSPEASNDPGQFKIPGQ